MNLKYVIISSLVLLAIVGCDSKERVKAPAAGHPEMPAAQSATVHMVKVEEAVHANSYTYLRVTEGEKEYWIATAKQPIEAGMTMYYDQGLEMPNFESKEMNRTFESITFVGKMRGTSSAGNLMAGSQGSSASPGQDKSIAVDKVSGGVNIQELYAGMSGLEGKTVSIKGQVTKFNANIMGRNWVHIQDGSNSGNHYDLTLTTKDVVKVGDVVVFSGKVTLNKDFGAGYKYDLIVEDAVLATKG